MRLFYWIGGSEDGQWNEAFSNVFPHYHSHSETVSAIDSMGFRWREVKAGEAEPKTFDQYRDEHGHESRAGE